MAKPNKCAICKKNYPPSFDPLCDKCRSAYNLVG